MPEPRQLHRASTRVFSVLMVLIGIGLIVSTLLAGGGPLDVGVPLGVGFCGVGAGRLWLDRERP